MRLWAELHNHPGEGHHGGHGDDGGGDFHGGFGGRRRHGPHGPGPERPPDPGPQDVEDVPEGPFRVVRSADMLVVDISLVNLRFDGHRLVPRDPGAAAFVLAGLPPQHVLEQAFPAGTTPPPGPVNAFTSGPTTLVFSVPADLDGLDLSLEALLDWGRLVPLTVPVGAQSPDTAGSTVFQGVPRSVLEFPTRLLITYDEPVDWWTRPEPHQVDGRAALWHARLRGTQDGDVLLRAFSAVRDRRELLVPTPLTAENLEDLVTLTSRAELVPPGGPPLDVPSAPLRSEQFIVTPLGASAHLHGAWEAADKDDETRYPLVGRPFPNLEAYDHITGLGRDQYVRVVTRGCLCTGHQASHVAEFRRVFMAGPDHEIVAYLRQEDRIIVKQPEVQYGQDTRYTYAGREMPFRSLRITDRVTPLIRPPGDTERPADPRKPFRDHRAFWVKLQSSGADHRFTLIGTDREGRKVSFSMPLVFVPDGLSDAEAKLEALYLEVPDRMKCSLDGQVMAMAQPPADAPGSTSHAVGSLTFGLGIIGRTREADGTREKDRYVVGLPHVRQAKVRVPAVEQFTPNAGDLGVVFNDTYLQQTMEKHPAGAYLQLQSPLELTLGRQQAGGVASPRTALKLITAQAGVVPDLYKTNHAGAVVGASDLADIKAAFNGAKLLGKIPLDQFLTDIPADHLDAIRNLGDEQIEAILHAPDGLLPAPVLRIRDLVDGQGKELRYVWKTKLGKPEAGKAATLPVVLENATLILDARTVRSQDAVDKATVEGRLSNFALAFAGIARVDIAELTFKTGPGKKPDVTASGLELKFQEDLEFINTLRDALPADVFGTGAYVDVDSSGVRAGYKFALPSIVIGVFTLSNVSLAAELVIPFSDAPVSFRFSVAEREHPFNATVSLFGGGGYFSMQVDTEGVRQVEGAIEFGGAAALDIGVASGGVSIMAGIRFTLATVKEGGKETDNVSLSGYLRCHGFLCVLGIVTVSVDFYLELTYEKHGRQSVVRGKGTLTVSVRIAFFSKSVTLELERSFSGAPGDPSFAECVPLEPHWREYCAAFAPNPHG
ncbi:hypothetical protein ABZ079_34470 [Streptomyces sp. NPDC006314]|uniref:hypothetical protein n=1 Tax=Streptomyces sp. NPDC006314 TaxID=3154475 RepID=UPI00339E9189